MLYENSLLRSNIQLHTVMSCNAMKKRQLSTAWLSRSASYSNTDVFKFLDTYR
jgi:hypothetical protein